MAATRPDKTLEWATSTGASVIEPPSAKRHDGWTGGEEPPASWFNWWQRLAWEWMTYLDAREDEREVADAERRDINLVANGRLMSSAMFFGGTTPKVPTASGLVLSGTRYIVFWTDGSYAWATTTTAWQAGPVVHANCRWVLDVPDAPNGLVIVVGAGGVIFRGTGHLNPVWTAQTPAEVADFTCALYRPESGRVFAATRNDQFQTSDDAGVTWAKRAFDGSGTIINALAHDGGADGEAVIVGVGTNGASEGVAARSEDEGNSWTLYTVPGAGALTDVLWSERRQAWFAAGVSYEVYTSVDGITWGRVLGADGLAVTAPGHRLLELEAGIVNFTTLGQSPASASYVRDHDALTVPTAKGPSAEAVVCRVYRAGYSAIWCWYRTVVATLEVPPWGDPATECVMLSDWFAPLPPPPAPEPPP